MDPSSRILEARHMLRDLCYCCCFSWSSAWNAFACCFSHEPRVHDVLKGRQEGMLLWPEFVMISNILMLWLLAYVPPCCWCLRSDWLLLRYCAAKSAFPCHVCWHIVLMLWPDYQSWSAKTGFANDNSSLTSHSIEQVEPSDNNNAATALQCVWALMASTYISSSSAITQCLQSLTYTALSLFLINKRKNSKPPKVGLLACNNLQTRFAAYGLDLYVFTYIRVAMMQGKYEPILIQGCETSRGSCHAVDDEEWEHADMLLRCLMKAEEDFDMLTSAGRKFYAWRHTTMEYRDSVSCASAEREVFCHYMLVAEILPAEGQRIVEEHAQNVIVCVLGPQCSAEELMLNPSNIWQKARVRQVIVHRDLDIQKTADALRAINKSKSAARQATRLAILVRIYCRSTLSSIQNFYRKHLLGLLA